jgi:hypothetical protein
MPTDDRTRDITLPPLPGRPPPVLPQEWAGLEPAAPEEPDPSAVEARRVATGRTDELMTPPGAAVRERTLAFSSPEMRHRPIDPVQVGSNPRRWPWVVLTLVPLLVILGFGVAWLVLFSRM